MWLPNTLHFAAHREFTQQDTKETDVNETTRTRLIDQIGRIAQIGVAALSCVVFLCDAPVRAQENTTAVKSQLVNRNFSLWYDESRFQLNSAFLNHTLNSLMPKMREQMGDKTIDSCGVIALNGGAAESQHLFLISTTGKMTQEELEEAAVTSLETLQAYLERHLVYEPRAKLDFRQQELSKQLEQKEAMIRELRLLQLRHEAKSSDATEDLASRLVEIKVDKKVSETSIQLLEKRFESILIEREDLEQQWEKLGQQLGELRRMQETLIKQQKNAVDITREVERLQLQQSEVESMRELHAQQIREIKNRIAQTRIDMAMKETEEQLLARMINEQAEQQIKDAAERLQIEMRVSRLELERQETLESLAEIRRELRRLASFDFHVWE